ncbi:hypothetical protein [Streptomyces sp. NPDC008150]|uniref:hypothetical protein n=1 Tax=Streptomyces sp. NPDC008150 TaxID=3364816 RepID=UPI0036E07857
MAEQYRIERVVSALRVGESAVINGTPVTVISLRVADLLDRYWAASLRCRLFAAVADYDGCLVVGDELAMCKRQLAEAGMLQLIEEVA